MSGGVLLHPGGSPAPSIIAAPSIPEPAPVTQSVSVPPPVTLTPPSAPPITKNIIPKNEIEPAPYQAQIEPKGPDGEEPIDYKMIGIGLAVVIGVVLFLKRKK